MIISSNLFATHSDMGAFSMKADHGKHVMTLRRSEPVGFLLDAYNFGLRMRRECRRNVFPATDFKGNR